MLGRFFYGQCSLSEAFWKFSILGLTGIGFITRTLMIFLKQQVNYDPRFFTVLINNISILSMNSTAFMLLCFYIASFLTLLFYTGICVCGMYNTYKEYEKSKTLAIICMIIIWVFAFTAIKFSIY